MQIVAALLLLFCASAAVAPAAQDEGKPAPDESGQVASARQASGDLDEQQGRAHANEHLDNSISQATQAQRPQLLFAANNNWPTATNPAHIQPIESE